MLDCGYLSRANVGEFDVGERFLGVFQGDGGLYDRVAAVEGEVDSFERNPLRECSFKLIS